MAEKMELSEKNVLVDKTRRNVGQIVSSGKEISSYKDCIRMILNLLTDFGTELKLGEAVLKVNSSVSAMDVTSLHPAQVFTCLQQHISKLQTVSESLKLLVDAEDQSSSAKGNMSAGCNDDAVATVSSEEEMMISDSEHIPTTARRGRPEVDEGTLQADDLNVQIRAGKSEIDRRISAFIERKQLEINENNVREFCNVIDCNQENSCARTDAVFTPYPGFKSHVKVTRVVNTYGPQTRVGGGLGEAGEQQRAPVSRDCGNPAIEERLHNIESHLKLPTAGPVPVSVYQRLKKLEDRILELDGLSPEYFQSTSYLHKRLKSGSSQACSLSELDGKINAMKAALLKRVNEYGAAYETEGPL